MQRKVLKSLEKHLPPFLHGFESQGDRYSEEKKHESVSSCKSRFTRRHYVLILLPSYKKIY